MKTELGELFSDTNSPREIDEPLPPPLQQSSLEQTIQAADDDLEAREALLALLENHSIAVTEPSVQIFLQRHGEMILKRRLEAIIGRHYTLRHNMSELRKIIKNDKRVALFCLTELQIYHYLLQRKLALTAFS